MGRVAHPDAREQKESGRVSRSGVAVLSRSIISFYFQPVYAPSAIAARGGKFRFLDGAPGYVTVSETSDPFFFTKVLKWLDIAYSNQRSSGYCRLFQECRYQREESRFWWFRLWVPPRWKYSVSMVSWRVSSTLKYTPRTDTWSSNSLIPLLTNGPTNGAEALKIGHDWASRFSKLWLKYLAPIELEWNSVQVVVTTMSGKWFHEFHSTIVNGMSCSMPLQDTLDTFGYLIREANKLKLAYIILVRYDPSQDPAFDGEFHSPTSSIHIFD